MNEQVLVIGINFGRYMTVLNKLDLNDTIRCCKRPTVIRPWVVLVYSVKIMSFVSVIFKFNISAICSIAPKSALFSS